MYTKSINSASGIKKEENADSLCMADFFFVFTTLANMDIMRRKCFLEEETFIDESEVNVR